MLVTRGSWVVIDHDLFDGVIGNGAVGGDDAGDRVAVEADFVGGERLDGDRMQSLDGGAMRSGCVHCARSWPVATITTPGRASASVASMATMRAWACGERTKRACSAPAMARSSM